MPKSTQKKNTQQRDIEAVMGEIQDLLQLQPLQDDMGRSIESYDQLETAEELQNIFKLQRENFIQPRTKILFDLLNQEGNIKSFLKAINEELSRLTKATATSKAFAVAHAYNEYKDKLIDCYQAANNPETFNQKDFAQLKKDLDKAGQKIINATSKQRQFFVGILKAIGNWLGLCRAKSEQKMHSIGAAKKGWFGSKFNDQHGSKLPVINNAAQLTTGIQTQIKTEELKRMKIKDEEAIALEALGNEMTTKKHNLQLKQIEDEEAAVRGKLEVAVHLEQRGILNDGFHNEKVLLNNLRANAAAKRNAMHHTLQGQSSSRSRSSSLPPVVRPQTPTRADGDKGAVFRRSFFEPTLPTASSDPTSPRTPNNKRRNSH